ncbi:nuclease-related domain-containing protein [Salicibibacter kimchii]|uniref:NERD domain-containing protein n=1 Tax=Salicibibacter kimchii TaxID=2099786 RepID=A0A345BY16_9BACI|nr:nuclease-related domain-containing protein [Salicibibacter kimchii]AXF55847.1 NERD domain-containing protein [Salicibibacter kimchii]
MRQIKEREEPSELTYLRLLKPRMHLTAEDKRRYWNLLKGFEGEKQYDRLLRDKLSSDCLVINDLLLEHNQTVFQIDSLLIFQKIIYLVDVKNFEGDFYTNEQRWNTVNGKEIKNPLLQLQRSESSFRQLLQSLKLDYPVNAQLVFINPEFYLYNASFHLPAVFPNQLYRFMKSLNDTPANISEKQEHLARHLVSRHLTKSPFTRVPDYDYHQLKRGIVCPVCFAFLSNRQNKWICHECGMKEKSEVAVLRTVN